MILLEADDHWNQTHRGRWLLRQAMFSAVLVGAALVSYLAA